MALESWNYDHSTQNWKLHQAVLTVWFRKNHPKQFVFILPLLYHFTCSWPIVFNIYSIEITTVSSQNEENILPFYKIKFWFFIEIKNSIRVNERKIYPSDYNYNAKIVTHFHLPKRNLNFSLFYDFARNWENIFLQIFFIFYL